MDAEMVRPVARRISEQIGAACELNDEGKILLRVAGSMRRGAADVDDLDIVCVSRVRSAAVDLFGESIDVPVVDDALERLVASGDLARPSSPCNGSRMKKFVVVELSGPERPFTLDLFITTRITWGSILAIRTGPPEFGKVMMTPRSLGGMMPADMAQVEGGLYRYVDRYRAAAARAARAALDGELVATPTERGYFEALGVEYVEPAERTGERARQMAAAPERGEIMRRAG